VNFCSRPDRANTRCSQRNTAVGGNKGATLGNLDLVQQKITKTLLRLWRPRKRQAVERNLRHYQKVERAIFARIYQQGMS
jgi:hypothetical protein